MIERKSLTQRHFICLSSKIRKNQKTYSMTHRKRNCRIALLSSNELWGVLRFLNLSDLSRLQEAMNGSLQNRDGMKTVIKFIAQTQRHFLGSQFKQFLKQFLCRRTKKTRSHGVQQYCCTARQIQRIEWDVQRAHVWSCKSAQEINGMRCYLKTVLVRLIGESGGYEYHQGLHCLVKAMYESQLNCDQAYRLGIYLLKEMGLARYYNNLQARIRQLCYVIDVYVFNNLPSLYQHLKRHHLGAQCYAIGWLLTLYSKYLPLHILQRLWTLFLLKGWKVIIKFTLALLGLFQYEILGHPQAQLPVFLGAIHGHLDPKKELPLWQLYCSIKVTNSMVEYLSRNMQALEYDNEISLITLKHMKENTLKPVKNNLEAPSFTIGLCCQRVTHSSTFPYCTDV